MTGSVCKIPAGINPQNWDAPNILVEFPYYTVIIDARQKYCLGYRPEDLAHIDTIEQKVWKKHEAHLNRLEQFPLEKAEYYLRLKEAHGVSSVRGLSTISGEDWSYIYSKSRQIVIFERSEI